MSSFASLMFAPEKGPDGKPIDPEERFIRMDGGPYYGSGMANMLYKNPQATIGTAIAFISPVYLAANYNHNPSLANIEIPLLICTMTALAVGTLVPYFTEQIYFQRYPNLRHSVIDRYGLMANDQDRFDSAKKVYRSRIKLGLIIGAVGTFNCLPNILSGGIFATSVVFALGPAISMITWAW